MTYAQAIIMLRKRLLLTQAEFAKKMGVAFATVNRWEKGLHEPTMKAKRKLAPLFKKYCISVGA